jgi:serine/threonine protein kinase
MFALKEFGRRYRHSSAQDRLRARREWTYGHGMKHPNTVRYLEMWEDDVDFFVLMELGERGSLAEYLDQYTPTEPQVWHWFYQLLLGLDYIHAKGLVHLDLKPHNIYLTANWSVKIGDYGLVTDPKVWLSSSTQQHDIYRQSLADSAEVEGDARYLAPEFFPLEDDTDNSFSISEVANNTNHNANANASGVLAGRPHIGYWSDIYSLGCILLEMSTNIELPTGGLPQWRSLRAGVFPAAFNQLSSELQHVIRAMMHPSPQKRPHTTDLLQFIRHSHRIQHFLRYSTASFHRSPLPHDGQHEIETKTKYEMKLGTGNDSRVPNVRTTCSRACTDNTTLLHPQATNNDLTSMDEDIFDVASTTYLSPSDNDNNNSSCDNETMVADKTTDDIFQFEPHGSSPPIFSPGHLQYTETGAKFSNSHFVNSIMPRRLQFNSQDDDKDNAF